MQIFVTKGGTSPLGFKVMIFGIVNKLTYPNQ
jgi:hypothetical protein